MKKYITPVVIIAALILGCDCDNGKITETGTAHFITKFIHEGINAELCDYTDEGYMLVNYCSNPYNGFSLAGYSPDKGVWSVIATSWLHYDDARYSPNRSNIAFESDFGLFVMDSDGSNLRQLGTSAWGFYDWFDNTRLLFTPFGDITKLYTIDIETEETEEFLDFFEVGSVGEGGSMGFFALSPDHKRVAFSFSVHYDPQDPLIYRTVIYDMDTLEYDIFDCKNYGFNAQFSPDSTNIVYGELTSPGSYREFWVYDIDTGDFSLMYRSDALFLWYPTGEWPGPFWTADGNGIITYHIDEDGDLSVYEVTPG
ncbi:MAG: hypothetical protein GY771_01100 [bacterium]|nr:hypothetical protein [bacterium]